MYSIRGLFLILIYCYHCYLLFNHFYTVPPVYTLDSQSLTLFNSTNSCISINIQAIPYPNNYSWIHGNTSLMMTTPSTGISTTPHSICFNPVLTSYNGSYTLYASNPAGNGNITFNLDVYCKFMIIVIIIIIIVYYYFIRWSVFL